MERWSAVFVVPAEDGRIAARATARRPEVCASASCRCIDAAPLVAALELGYFADEGLNVVLERQIGWGNVRDKLAFGQLDASHAVLGMPLAQRRPGASGSGEPLVA